MKLNERQKPIIGSKIVKKGRNGARRMDYMIDYQVMG